MNVCKNLNITINVLARHGQNGSPRRVEEEITNDTDKGKEDLIGEIEEDDDEDDVDEWDEEETAEAAQDEKIQDSWSTPAANLTSLGGMYGPSASDSRFKGFSYPSPSDIALLAKQQHQRVQAALGGGGGGGGGRGRKNGNKRGGGGGGKKGKKGDDDSWQSALGGFYPVVSSGTREMAFVHAISSAGVAHALTRACSSGELENCGCDRSLRGMSPEGFQVS